jgi:copper homeostasis protein
MDTSRIFLEICTVSVEDCITAETQGADRVELNSALMLGGLTPSLGTLIESKARVKIPIISMARPRAAGFNYSAIEFATMQRDIDLLLEHGADGIAFGVLKADGTVDGERCRAIVRQIGSREAVFHRAFDVVPDPQRTMEELVDLGVKRIMTSGQEASAYNGAANIARYIQQAAGRVEILPAGGINRFTLEDVVRRTGCTQVHASLSGTHRDGSTQARPQVAFGGTLKPSEEEFTGTDARAVERVRQMLDTNVG